VTSIPARARYRTGSEELDARLAEVLDEVGATQDRDQLFEILVSAVRLANDDADRLDLKITNAVLKEMREAFAAFAPYEDRKKVTIFGSARTRVDHPAYVQARDLAARLAAEGWMVVTGAGPGIMSAGLEGAGRPNSFGVNIRLPFEQAPNPYIDGDPKLISMKYFFTRKLMLVKESHGFVSLPGGFGTLDETFELLTLFQTGKSPPAPLTSCCTASPTRSRSRRKSCWRSGATSTPPAGCATASSCACTSPRRRISSRPSTATSRTSAPPAPSRPPTRSPRSGRQATCSSCRGSCSSWTRRATPGSGR
jgi:uncharacterized protein (TIGR00730 family)